MEWENQLIQELQWSNKISNKASKELVAQEIAGLAKDGDVIGAGSGSTVYLTLFALAQRVKQESLHIEIIPASAEISMTCIQLGLPQTTLWNKRPDWTFDGADEVDPHNNLIKGRGGAMFKEKLLIKAVVRLTSLSMKASLSANWGTNTPYRWKYFHMLSPMWKTRYAYWELQKSAYVLQKEKTVRYLPKTVISFLTFISATLFLIWNRN